MTITDKLNIDKLNHDIEISDLQSDSDLDSIRNSCNFFAKKILNDLKTHICKLVQIAWPIIDLILSSRRGGSSREGEK